jgi:hypothetical protein
MYVSPSCGKGLKCRPLSPHSDWFVELWELRSLTTSPRFIANQSKWGIMKKITITFKITDEDWKNWVEKKSIVRGENVFPNSKFIEQMYDQLFKYTKYLNKKRKPK